MGRNTIEREAPLAVAKGAVHLLLKKIVGVSYFSQATQDLFALAMLPAVNGGFYVEIGSGDPELSSNTLLLERHFGWSGVSIDRDLKLVSKFNCERLNPAINSDALLCDYAVLLDEHEAPVQVDYLTIDIEPANQSLAVLEELLDVGRRYSVITFEHDLYCGGTNAMHASRYQLQQAGYELVVENVKCFGAEFEDWWVDPQIVPEDLWKPFKHQSIEFSDLWLAVSNEVFPLRIPID